MTILRYKHHARGSDNISKFTSQSDREIMDRIVLEVDNATAMAYRNISLDARLRIARAIGLFLKKAMNDTTSSDYQKMLNEMGDEATKNGLTPEALNELLRDDDE